MLFHWSKIRVPVTLLHGTENTVVSPGHAEFIEERLAHTSIDIRMLPGHDHYVPDDAPELIRDALSSTSTVKSVRNNLKVEHWVNHGGQTTAFARHGATGELAPPHRATI